MDFFVAHLFSFIFVQSLSKMKVTHNMDRKLHVYFANYGFCRPLMLHVPCVVDLVLDINPFSDSSSGMQQLLVPTVFLILAPNIQSLAVVFSSV